MLPNNNSDTKKLLGGLSLFAELAPKYLGGLVLASRYASFKRGQAIYRVGERASEMYVLLSGQVKLALECGRGNEKVIDVLDAGRTFGEAELFGTHPYVAGATAVMPTQLLCLDGEHVRGAVELYPGVAAHVIRLLAQRQVELEVELTASHFCSGSHRLLDFFLCLAGPSRDLAEETVVTLNISKRLLASRLDMQPETLSRTLRDLTEAGLIAVDGCHVRLKNARIARHLADESSAQPILLPHRLRPTRADGNGYAAITSASSAAKPDAAMLHSCATINLAGRQRMLSQRMAKSWLMLERGVFSRRARLILKQSADMFDSELRDLKRVANSAESRAARAELSRVWRPYSALLSSEPSIKGASKLFALSEEVLAAAQNLTDSFERADGTRQGKLVNLAGRARMLSQRMAKLFVFQHMDIQKSKCRTELQGASREFSSALVKLNAATPSGTRISAELKSVAGHWNAFQSAMAIKEGFEFGWTARKVFVTSENLLRRTNATVELYASRPD